MAEQEQELYLERERNRRQERRLKLDEEAGIGEDGMEELYNDMLKRN